MYGYGCRITIELFLVGGPSLTNKLCCEGSQMTLIEVVVRIWVENHYRIFLVGRPSMSNKQCVLRLAKLPSCNMGDGIWV